MLWVKQSWDPTKNPRKVRSLHNKDDFRKSWELTVKAKKRAVKKKEKVKIRKETNKAYLSRHSVPNSHEWRKHIELVQYRPLILGTKTLIVASQ